MTASRLCRLLTGAACLLGITAAHAANPPPGVPASIRDSGTLHLSVNAIYPPMEFKDPGDNKLVGLDIDLGEALAERMGLKIVWQESAFEQLIPSLTTGRTDFILSGISDLPARRETMDFVDYLQSGAQFYTLAASPFKAPEDLCGKRVGTSRTTSFPAQIRAFSAAHCEAAGKPAIVEVDAESTVDARAQLKQGRIDAAVQGAETIPYFMGQDPGTFSIVGAPFTMVRQGIAFRKTDTAFRDAVADTLGALIADGTYGRILAKWHLSANAVPAPLINGEKRP
jgi:polar amino acid transport system substrate-binding protein